MPRIVHVLRDGVSDGQYGTLLEDERVALKNVLHYMGVADRVKLVITAVTKRHMVRLYDVARHQNPMWATTVIS